MRTIVLGLAVAVVSFAVTACTSTGGTGGTLDGTSWALKTYDVSGTATAVPAGIAGRREVRRRQGERIRRLQRLQRPGHDLRHDDQGRHRRHDDDGLRP